MILLADVNCPIRVVIVSWECMLFIMWYYTVSLNLAETWLLAIASWERTMCWRSAILGCPDRRMMGSTPHQGWNRSQSSGLHRKHWTMVKRSWCLCWHLLKLLLSLNKMSLFTNIIGVNWLLWIWIYILVKQSVLRLDPDWCLPCCLNHREIQLREWCVELRDPPVGNL